jgi:hypothetical protein
VVLLKAQPLNCCQNTVFTMATDQERPSSEPAERAALARFCRTVAANPVHQARLKACSTPEAILAMAEELDCPFAWQTLRSRSSDLAADYWPWAQKGTIWRREFFQAAALGDVGNSR